MQTSERPAELAAMIAEMDEAVALGDHKGLCEGVKQALKSAIRRGATFLTEEMITPAPDAYARRLLHKDPAGRYSIVVMVWGADQGTPVHDHDGRWCVECVYQGNIFVTSYSRVSGEDDALWEFERETETPAGIGAAGALIPPFEYHKIENHHPETAVTIHVYEGEMEECRMFHPMDDGRWRPETKPLRYTD